MSKRSDEVYYGHACGVCEELFMPIDDVVFVPNQGVRVHRRCWETLS